MNIAEFKKAKRDSELRVMQVIQEELERLDKLADSEGSIDRINVYLTDITRMQDRCRKYVVSDVRFHIDLDE